MFFYEEEREEETAMQKFRSPGRFIRVSAAFVAVMLTFSIFSMFVQIGYSYAESSGSEEQSSSGRRIVKVAFPVQDGMSYIENSGKVTGYNYDYLEKISEYTGWKMEYVTYPSDDGNEAVGTAMADLMAGKVDLMGPILKNDSTEDMFEFPDHSYGTVYTTLCALSSGAVREKNLDQYGTLRVGLWDSAETRNSEVLAFLESEKLSYDIIYYSSAEEQAKALNDGEVDLISSVSLSPVINTRIVAQFAPRPFYLVSTKGNTELVKQLSNVIEKINKAEINLQDDLYEKYFKNTEDVFVLTTEQKRQLRKIDSMNVLCLANDAPYVYERDGRAAGMLVSILDDFSLKTGLKMNYEFAESRSEAEKMMEDKKYDMLIGMPLTSNDCAELGFINSVSVLESVLAYAQNASGTDRKRIAVVRGTSDRIDLTGYSDDDIILCDSIRECIGSVESGRADIAAGDRSGLLYYITDCGSSLVTSPMPGQTRNISVAVSRERSSMMLDTLNNYIYSISEADLANYLSEGNIHVNSVSMTSYIRRHPIQSIIIVIALMAALALIVLIAAMESSKKQSVMQQEHNSQLKEALDIARDANESKTTFLSNMSHDIRTPMNAVIGFATLLAKDPDDGVKVREYARKISAASNHLLGLINDILDISKIESGKVSLHPSVFSLDELLESINVVVRPMAGEKQQSFDVTIGYIEHELFVGDKVRINQILINLLSNAVKYTPENGHIEFDITDKGNSSTSFINMEFRVKDDGYGITEEFKKIIFDPFTRSESSTVNKEVGTGLGLAITKNIIDLMGGTIDLESEVGKGSTFTVELPLRIPHEEEDEHFWENHGVTRILLVDDDKDICDSIKEHMKDTGVNFDTAYSGESAVQIVRHEYAANRNYSAIILDWQMPGMNGLETAREIRKIVPIDTPILFLTSYDWSEIETEALEAEVDGFISKPFTVLNLKEKLIEVEHFKNSVADTEDVEIDLNGMHFLLVEDNELNVEILSAILESEGATCELAGNGKIAVDMFTAAPAQTYDAVLMDIMMPVMNGYDATKAIRNSDHPEAKSIPIIAMTANAFVKDVQDALDAGMNAHIAKPINMETLKNTLSWCIKKQ